MRPLQGGANPGVEAISRLETMNEDEYKDFVAQVNSGTLLVGVDRAVARYFYMYMPLSKIREETGYAPHFEKMVVWLIFIMEPIALIASFALSVLAFRWWAMLAIPLSIIVYYIYASLSSMPRKNMLGITGLLALAICSLFADFFATPFISWYMIILIFALWLSRFIYCIAKYFMLNIVLENKQVLDFMKESIHVRNAGY